MKNSQSKSNTVLCDICNNECDYIEIIIYIPDDIGFIDKDVRLVIAHCYVCDYNFISNSDFIERRRLLTTITETTYKKTSNGSNTNGKG